MGSSESIPGPQIILDTIGKVSGGYAAVAWVLTSALGVSHSLLAVTEGIIALVALFNFLVGRDGGSGMLLDAYGKGAVLAIRSRDC